MFIRELIQSVLEMPGAFTDIALHDPLSAVLLALGTVIMLFSIGFFGLLVLGSVLDLFTPEPAGAPGQPGR